MSQEVVHKLFKSTNISLGVQVEFAYQWSKWIQFNRDNLPVIENGQLESSEYNNTNNIVQIASTTQFLKLDSILKSNAYGLSIIAAFKDEKKLDDNTRKLLCEAIIQFCIEKNHSLTVYDAENITKQIVTMFPDEVAVKQFGIPNCSVL